jgi:hypothetical protein
MVDQHHGFSSARMLSSMTCAMREFQYVSTAPSSPCNLSATTSLSTSSASLSADGHMRKTSWAFRVCSGTKPRRCKRLIFSFPSARESGNSQRCNYRTCTITSIRLGRLIRTLYFPSAGLLCFLLLLSKLHLIDFHLLLKLSTL